MRSTVVASRKLPDESVPAPALRLSKVRPAAPAAVSLSISRRDTGVDSLEFDIKSPERLQAWSRVRVPQVGLRGHDVAQTLVCSERHPWECPKQTKVCAASRARRSREATACE